MTPQQYNYFAFVSYRSSDEKWAKWLQEKIEAYRLPTTIQHENSDLPKTRLRPCFRYHTDIQPNELKTELRNKLEQSKYLLVICSPRSAQSQWVGKEIETFVELGRRDRIIPVIVEGRPYSGDTATECYNPSLLKYFPHSDNIDEDQEILGVNIHEEGSGSAYMKRERAVMQVVSRMLGVSFDRIWQRQKRRIIRRAILSTLAIILVLAALLTVWLMNQPFNSRVELYEQSPYVRDLPVMHDAVLTMTLPDEERADTLVTWENFAVFRYLPAKLKNQNVSIHVEAPDYLPLDTVVALTEELRLPLSRDPQVYGALSATILLDDHPLPNTRIQVESFETMTDAAGHFELFVPLEQQKKSYFISVPSDYSLSATLHAPCGPNDIVLL
ncbi:MAG: toll/interleukin-1 receptor domain-containing protein [Paludibacteraceae bacterium]|nr:toll/interleukin-1 receptor domain-containing protein [Paludibacteraceae bacterium]